MLVESQDYSRWSHEDLQEHIKILDVQLEHLEKQLANGSTNSKFTKVPKPKNRPGNPRSKRDFDPRKYSSRLIALKFAYLGKRYNGFEYHPNNTTPLPTVEETLWKALMKARLVFPTSNPPISDGEPDFGGCEYSKCGRTDKGVSAFGQVIALRVRSNRPLSWAPTSLEPEGNGQNREKGHMATHEMELAAPSLRDHDIGDDLPTPTSAMSLSDETLSFHPIHDEIPYCQVLNRLLPPDIRILAWCPAPPLDFSARFSCGERQYTYFFTQPAFTPTPGSTAPLHSHKTGAQHKQREGYLNILAMRVAAQKFIGLHDFRNFCKVDGSKQIDNFHRRIFHADIVEHSPTNIPAAYASSPNFQEQNQHEQELDAKNPPSPLSSNLPPESVAAAAAAALQTPSDLKLYAFTLHGNAFLWHQVRHMVAILFLIGQGLESACLIDDLLDPAKTPTKPQYEMADAAPLVLWNCVFPRESEKRGAGGRVDDLQTSTETETEASIETRRGVDALEWVYVGDDTGRESGLLGRRSGKTDGKWGFGGVVEDLWRVWRGRKMDEVLAGMLLDLVVRQGNSGGGLGDGPDAHNELRGGGKGENGGREFSVSSSTSSFASQRVFHGGDGPKFSGVYVPVLAKPRMESVEVINARYREKKGFVTAEDVKAEGWRTVPMEKSSGMVDE